MIFVKILTLAQKLKSMNSLSTYQKFLIVILALIQFTVVLDFMILSPLGVILIKNLAISPAQFGLVVSAYAFSAAISGIIAAGFADKYDRKKFLLFFYVGFTLGTLCCGLANTYTTLLLARIVTGIFGGVIGSVCFAIGIDSFPAEMRGRVMGLLQSSFAAAQILGLPIGLFLANKYSWQFPFLAIVGLCMLTFLAIILKMKPIDGHLKIVQSKSPFAHFWATLTNKKYLIGYLSTIFLATGGYMLMPFGSDYSNHNLGVALADIPKIYLITGIFGLGFAPLMGKLADRFGGLNVFGFGSILASVLVYIYCHLGLVPFWVVVVVNVVMFAGISARMISSALLISNVPGPADKGAFMSINSSVQQVSGGIASFVAGLIVHKNADGSLGNYPNLGYVVMSTMAIAFFSMWVLNKNLNQSKLNAPANA